jgi:hypothetical protein
MTRQFCSDDEFILNESLDKKESNRTIAEVIAIGTRRLEKRKAVGASAGTPLDKSRA